ncbi:ice-binding family protein [Micromonospora lupini]|uniref:ice-binding family protein n=1 Tax=Micromonospora lupini TaxID=285679 RepID=UPI0022540637|nr:ice-binding family protein [Micromonospora lupini]MCX5068144.1 ice-binding family protein [Micromonospora lupini]
MSRTASALTLVGATTVLVIVAGPPSASAAESPVPLGTAADFAVLAGTTVTNTGLSVVTGDLGVSPGTAVTGFPPGQLNGAIHSNDGPAVQAKSDLAVAYNNAASRTTTDVVATELGGTTKTTGVYESAGGTFTLAGDLTLDAEGDPNAVFIFKTTTTLITGASSTVNLINGAQSCNVFWQVGSSVTLGANSLFRGNLLTFTSITVGAALEVDGRAMAINGAVTMDTDTVTRSTCAEPGELSISAPETATLSSAGLGGVASGSLGSVTVTDERLLSAPTWTATVVATNFVTSGLPVHSIASTNVSCWSGPATATSGIGTFTSGQPTAGDAEIINVERTAFTLTDGIGNNSATWNPVVSVQIPLTAVAGTYTGTVTFSVA